MSRLVAFKLLVCSVRTTLTIVVASGSRVLMLREALSVPVRLPTRRLTWKFGPKPWLTITGVPVLSMASFVSLL